MGAYLTKPDKRVHLVEGSTHDYDFAAGSMKGWRMSNEDAHTCLTNFDQDAYLFAVFDGHGGLEVAEYAAEKLPEFIKNNKHYKEGNFEEALKQAFIEFDKSIPANIDALKEIKLKHEESEEKDDEEQEADQVTSQDEPQASSSSAAATGSSNGEATFVEDVDSETLRREATVPLEELLTKYCQQKKKNSLLSKYFNSPIVQKKKPIEQKETAATSSSQASDEQQACSSSDGPSDSGDKPQASSSKETKDDQEVDDEDEGNEEVIERPKVSNKLALLLDLMNQNVDDEEGDDEEDSEYDSETDATDEEDDDDEDEDDEAEQEDTDESPKKASKKYNEVDINSESDDDEEGADEDEEDEEDDDDDEMERQMPILGPGYDSGCTAVVALVKNNVLYVANAGDSRCVVLKKGEYKAMSFDHKPTDEIETKRIKAAGGKVIEGRVNGGLNLSRALGDFSYKDQDASPEDQMISPVPDIQKIDLKSDEYDYIVVACDGIWNSLETDDLGKFVYEYTEKDEFNGELTELIRGIFKFCLAPNTTDGDGSGCDNMTCIVLKFKKHNLNGNGKDVKEGEETNEVGGNKRKLSIDSTSEPSSVKKKCIVL